MTENIIHHFLQLVEEPIITPTTVNETTTLYLQFASNKIEVIEEVEAYPALSLVADVGGVLGLFIGFNFLMVLDWIMCGVNKFWRRTTSP